MKSCFAFAPRVPVAAAVILLCGASLAELATAALDRTPVRTYATYFGGAADDESLGLAVDSLGNAVFAGVTQSSDLTVTRAIQAANAGNGDVFVTKFNASGSQVIFSTFFGGSGRDVARAVAIDVTGAVYVTGETTSSDFPTTQGALQPASGGGVVDGFLFKLSPEGGLVYSTYLGGTGNEAGRSLVVDAEGRVYVVGRTSSLDFPTRNSIQGTHGGGPWDAFMLRVDASGRRLEFSSFLGGSGDDGAYGVVVDQSGAATIAGYGSSTNFPVRNAIQSTNAGAYDALVWKLTPDGGTLTYSTYLGGSADDYALAIASDAVGNVYLTGAASSPNFPLVRTRRRHGGGQDAFISQINADGTLLLYSAQVGGTGADLGFGVAVDPLNLVYIAGRTNSLDYPVVDALQAQYGGGRFDGFLSRIDVGGDALITSTYVGGSDFDSSGATDISSGGSVATPALGEVLLTGFTASTDFPTTSPLQNSNHGGVDSFIARLSSVEIAFVSPPGGAPGSRVRLTGANFVAGLTVTIGGASATVVSQTSDVIEAVVGTPAVAGAADVVVRNPNGQQAVLANGFFYPLPSDGRLSIDSPAFASTVTQPFAVTGWTIDRASTEGTGVDAVHVYALPLNGDQAAPVFVGSAAYGVVRDDVAAIYGSRFAASGFALLARGLAPGRYLLVISARSTNTRSFSIVKTTEITALAMGVPGVPASLTHVVSGRTVTLTWVASTPTAANYIIEGGSIPGASNVGVVVTQNARTTATFNDVADGTFYVRVKGRNVAGVGLPSSETIVSVGCAPPAAPSSLRFDFAGEREVRLLWSGPSLGPSPGGYLVAVGSRSGSDDLLTTDVGLMTTVTGSVPPGDYYVRVNARNTCGIGAASNEVRIVVP